MNLKNTYSDYLSIDLFSAPMIIIKSSVYFVQFRIAEKKLFIYDLNNLEETQISWAMFREGDTG